MYSRHFAVRDSNPKFPGTLGPNGGQVIESDRKMSGREAIIIPMYIETVPNRNSRPANLLRKGWREGKRVRKKTLANRALAPLLFDDETLHQACRTRDPVATAKPMPRARKKKACRRTDDALALHSLDTLLAELATRCRNTCRVRSDPTAPPFSLLTEPTQTQRRAAQLIEMFPVPGTVKI